MSAVTLKWRLASKPPGVLVHCPGCDVELRLDHDIDAAGTVQPSLDCPLCPFHESGVRLMGWALGTWSTKNCQLTKPTEQPGRADGSSSSPTLSADTEGGQ